MIKTTNFYQLYWKFFLDTNHIYTFYDLCLSIIILKHPLTIP